MRSSNWKREKFLINGKNYNTKDGTPIRDFININDLSEIHFLSAKYLIKHNKSQILNCGYGKGYSVKEILNNMNKILRKKIPEIYGERRLNDIEYSVADTKKFQKLFRWKPKFKNINKTLMSSLKWEKKLKQL